MAPTLRDSQLAAQAQELRDSYLAESAARLAAAGGELDEVQRHVAKAKAPLLQQVAAPEAEGSCWVGASRVDNGGRVDGRPCVPAAGTCCVHTLHAVAATLLALRWPSGQPWPAGSTSPRWVPLSLALPAALLSGWHLRAVALFVQHGREQHSAGEGAGGRAWGWDT